MQSINELMLSMGYIKGIRVGYTVSYEIPLQGDKILIKYSSMNSNVVEIIAKLTSSKVKYFHPRSYNEVCDILKNKPTWDFAFNYELWNC